MLEEVALQQPSYGSFIREAFIDPIRTVIVVDDEFPTLEALLDKETNPKDEHSWKPEDLRRAREIISFCREDDRKWMVEINDGQFPPDSGMDTAITHLHQSDLLILDYHLDRDPTRQNDGARAIQILRHLAGNDHFNLVVVYTKGYDGQIEQVAREIAIGLSCRHPGMDMPVQALEAANQIVEGWEDEDPDIAERLRDSVDEVAYLKARPMISAARWDDALDIHEMQPFREVLAGAATPLEVKQRRQILKWALHHRQQVLLPHLSQGDADEVTFAWGIGSSNWIRTERLFVTVLGKTNEPNELPEKLAVALEKWNPEPHRLLMSRMRAELDEKGVLAEGEILGNCCLQMGWLEEFLTADAAARTWKIRNTVTRHWESLGDGIQKEVLSFSERLADHILMTEGREAAFARYAPFKPGEKRHEIALHMNRYVCSKQVGGHHLSTGHILRLVNGAQKNYWLCLSPACDLEPKKETTGRPKRLKNYVAFTAVELFPVNPVAALANAPGGNYLFLEVAGKVEVECFSFTPPLPIGGDNEFETRVANPKWEQMFADNQGRFDDTRHLNLHRIKTDEEEMKLTIFPVEAQVVAQLRYEYALNLLQRLGANLSRVGLDFIRPS